MVSVVSKIVNDDEEFVLPPYIDYSVTYADGGEIEEKQLLKKADQSTTPSTPTRERYKVRVEYKTNISNKQFNLPTKRITKKKNKLKVSRKKKIIKIRDE